MILVRVDSFDNFGSYVRSLSKPARKNYKAVQKMYGDCKIQVASGDFPIQEVAGFMKLWEHQLIRGSRVEWAFPVETVAGWWNSGNLKLFRYCSPSGDVIGMHFIQKRDGYWECHPPMYDKVKWPSLAKWMWFSLIEYAIDQRLNPLDLGGMSDDWHYNLKTWREYKHQYKWHFVPLRARTDPDSEPKYYIGRPSCRLLKG